jgi:hypothetical protein
VIAQDDHCLLPLEIRDAIRALVHRCKVRDCTAARQPFGAPDARSPHINQYC